MFDVSEDCKLLIVTPTPPLPPHILQTITANTHVLYIQILIQKIKLF